MLFFLGLLVGVTASIVFSILRRTAQGQPLPDPEPLAVPPRGSDSEVRRRQRVSIGFEAEFFQTAQGHLQALAGGSGREIGDLATAIEGHANLLCEAIGDPVRVAERAEQLWTSVRRVRLFSEKLLSFSHPPEIDSIPMELIDLLDDMRSDLESYGSGAFQVRFENAPFLPPANVDPEKLRLAVLFLVDTLLELQPDTRQISLRAFTALPEDEGPIVSIELCAEHDGDTPVRTQATSNLQLGYLAARNMLEGMRAHLAFEHVEELDVSCQIMLAAVLDSDIPVIDAANKPKQIRDQRVNAPSRHHFGGILILEDDRSVRELLAMELGRSGRNILTCTDGAAARSLIEATPERFELLVLDSAAPMESGDHLAMHAFDLEPAFKILLLTDALSFPPARDPSLTGRLAELRKPFSLSDLRDAVRYLLGAYPPPRIEAGRNGHAAAED